MSENRPQTLKLMTKAHFDLVRTKFNGVEPKADKEIIDAKPSDILILVLEEGSDYKVINAKKFNEDNPEVFLRVLRDGLSAIQD